MCTLKSLKTYLIKIGGVLRVLSEDQRMQDTENKCGEQEGTEGEITGKKSIIIKEE